MTKIDRPIFIIGNIRSGTTILYNLLSLHPDVCWFSNHSDRLASAYGVAFLHRFLDIPSMRDRQARAIAENRRMFKRFNIVPWPDEGDRIYHEHSGLGQTQNGVETTLTDEMERQLTRKIREHLELTGKSRFLSKQTANNRRLGLIAGMFPDAYFVHVIRDGRAVANSTIRVPWWNDTHVWWLGCRASEWEARGREPIELCGLYWQRTLEEIFRNKEMLGERYTEVRYEALVADVPGVIGEILSFCGLESDAAYDRALPPELPDMNRKWREQLTGGQRAALEGAVGDFLAALGYDPE